MIGGDFDTPIMYQDLANSSMGPMSMPFGAMTGMYTPSYLGGIQMRQQPDADSVELINRKNKEGKNTLKKALIAAGAILLVGFVPHFAKKIRKAGGLFDYIKQIFSPKPKLTRWQKFKKFFGIKPKTTP